MLLVRRAFAARAGLLVLVKAFVGGFQEFGRRKPVLRVDGKADADGEGGRVGLQTQGGADAAGDMVPTLAVSVQQKKREFVTAVTRGYFRGAALILHHPGQAVESAVAGQVAEAVVDGLQVIEIEKQESERLMSASSAADLAFETFIKLAVIGQAGQAVMRGAVANLLLGFLALGDIESCTDAAN